MELVVSKQETIFRSQDQSLVKLSLIFIFPNYVSPVSGGNSYSSLVDILSLKLSNYIFYVSNQPKTCKNLKTLRNASLLPPFPI